MNDCIIRQHDMLRYLQTWRTRLLHALLFTHAPTGSNALILWHYPSSHGAWLNLASALFGVGCFLAPVLADIAGHADTVDPDSGAAAGGANDAGPHLGPFALHGGDSALAYYIVAAGAAACCLWTSLLPSPERPPVPEHHHHHDHEQEHQGAHADPERQALKTQRSSSRRRRGKRAATAGSGSAAAVAASSAPLPCRSTSSSSVLDMG